MKLIFRLLVVDILFCLVTGRGGRGAALGALGAVIALGGTFYMATRTMADYVSEPVYASHSSGHGTDRRAAGNDPAADFDAVASSTPIR